MMTIAASMACLTMVFSGASAQTIDLAKGLSPFAHYQDGNFDHINLDNGNIYVAIPLLSYPQLGHDLTLDFFIRANNKQWRIVYQGFESGSNTPIGNWRFQSQDNSDIGANVVADQFLNWWYDTVVYDYNVGTGSQPITYGVSLLSGYVTTADGASHYYADGTTTAPPVNAGPLYSPVFYSNFYPALDGSGLVPASANFGGSGVEFLGYTPIVDRRGIKYSLNGGTETKQDSNGNVITSDSSGWHDTIGRTIPGSFDPPGTSSGLQPIPGVPTDTSHCAGGASSARLWQVPTADGNQSYYLCYSSIAYQTDFAPDIAIASQHGFSGLISDANGTATLLTQVVLPNTTSYSFTYDSYLSLKSITLPTGAVASYTWQNEVFNQVTPSAGAPVSRALASRTLDALDGAGPHTWHYQWAYNATTETWTHTITDPLQNDEVHSGLSFLFPGTSEVDYYSGCSPNNALYCSGAGTVLEKVVTTPAVFGCPGDIGATVTKNFSAPNAVVTSLYSATGTSVSEKDYAYVPSVGVHTQYDLSDPSYVKGENPPTATPYPNCNSYQQVRSITSYDFGSGAPGPKLRIDTKQYLWETNPSYGNGYNTGNANAPTVNNLDLVAVGATTLADGSGTTVAETDYGYDEANGSPQGTIGNQTSQTQLLIGGQSPKTQVLFNTSGMPTMVTDPKGYKTLTQYQCSGLLPLSVTSAYQTPIAETTTYGYDCATGLRSSVTDPNMEQTKYFYNDSLSRLREIQYPDSGDVTINYNGDPVPPLITTTTATGEAAGPIQRKISYDGLGRVTQTQLAVDPSTADHVDTTYDALGRVQSVSNAYQSTGDLTYGITSFAYDSLGRKVMQCNADNTTTPTTTCTAGASYQRWTYAGNIVTFTDEGGSQWEQTTDGLGRLTRVREPSGGTSKAPTLETDYTYNTVGNLLTVNQLGTAPELPRPRSFTYDSLSRLVCASNPETEASYVACPPTVTGSNTMGTVGYSYDANSNLISRTDARGITTIYDHYDALNRVGLKTYSDGTPSVSFAYDVSALHGTGNLNFVGRLAQVTTMGTSSILNNYSIAGYDQVGRPKGYTECNGTSDCTTAAGFQQVGYQYDLAGNPVQVSSASSYGSITGANQRNFTYDAASNLISVTAANSPANIQNGVLTTLLKSRSYGPSGLLTGASLAVDPQSNQPAIGLTRTYDQRFRRTSETDTQLPAGSSTAASVTVNVSGTEQSIGGSGTAAQASGTIVLSYHSGAQVMRPIPLFVGSSITLPNGYRASFVAPSNSAVGVANALAAVLNTASSPVMAVVASGGTTSSASVTLTTKTTGADQNGPITLRLVSQVTSAPASLAGGAGTTFDAGIVTVNLNGTNLTTTYDQTSTPLTVVQGLASAINGANLGFAATTASPGSLNVTANQPGPADNGLPLSISSSSDEPSLFPSPSFTGGSGVFGGGADSTIYSYTIPSPATATSGYAPNGNLLSYTDTMDGTADAWNFTANGAGCYDPLNRLTCANATSGGWAGLNLSWTYDSFGNRTLQSISGSPNTPVPQTESAKYDTDNNHVTFATTASAGFSYDNSGNVTNDGINSYAYDGEGRLCAALNGTTQVKTGYAYDGLGNRVAKGTIGGPTLTCDSSAFTATTNFVVGLNGEQLDELDGQGTPQHSNVYANGQLLATYVYPQSKWMYAFSDWLGTKRVTTDPARTMTETCLSLPFGDALNCSGGIDPSEHHFTGKERDAESGNDYFEARYYSSSMGRFMSPDWSAKEDPVPYAQMDDPQSLNLYSYVRNNPLSRTDPDGHCDSNGQNCSAWDHIAGAIGGALNIVPMTLNLPNQAFNAISGAFNGPQIDLIPMIQADAHASGVGVNSGEAMQMLVPIGDAAKGAQILENAAKGAAGEAKVASELVSEGKTILGSQVGVQTDQGLRVVDHLVQDGQKLGAVEVKTGNATRNASQLAKDASMESNGGKIVGKNAPANLRGQTVKMPTEVRKPQP